MKTISGSPYRPEVHAQLNAPEFINPTPFNDTWKDDPNFNEQVEKHIKAQTLLLPFLYDVAEKVLTALGKEPGSDITYYEFWYKAEEVCTPKPQFGGKGGWLCMNAFDSWEPVIEKAWLLSGATQADELVTCNLIGTDIFPNWNMDAILEHIFGIVFTKDDPHRFSE